jgi:hypothetical protein
MCVVEVLASTWYVLSAIDGGLPSSRRSWRSIRPDMSRYPLVYPAVKNSVNWVWLVLISDRIGTICGNSPPKSLPAVSPAGRSA